MLEPCRWLLDGCQFIYRGRAPHLLFQHPQPPPPHTHTLCLLSASHQPFLVILPEQRADRERLHGLYQTPVAPRFLQALFSDDELIKIKPGSRDADCQMLLPSGKLCAADVPSLKTNPRACAEALCWISINKSFLTMQIEAHQLLAWGWKRAKNGWVC